MIGPYDQLLVGYVRSKGSILVTNNRHEFDRVPDLRMGDGRFPSLYGQCFDKGVASGVDKRGTLIRLDRPACRDIGIGTSIGTDLVV